MDTVKTATATVSAILLDCWELLMDVAVPVPGNTTSTLDIQKHVWHIPFAPGNGLAEKSYSKIFKSDSKLGVT